MISILIVWFLAIAAAEVGITGPTRPALLGVDLGDTYITAAIFNGSGAVPLGRRLGSKAYQQLMASHKTVGSYEPPGDEHAEDIIVAELNASREEARMLGTPDLHVGTITHPAWFPKRDQPLTTVWHTAQALEPLYFDSSVRVRRAYFPTLYTWPADGCQDTLLDLHATGASTMVMLFEQSRNELRSMVSYIDPGIHELEFDLTVSWPVKTDTMSAIMKDALQLVPADTIGGVLFSAEHPSVNFTLIQELLQVEHPDLASRIRDLPPSLDYVHAIGAACYARQIAAFPEVLEGTDSVCEVPDEPDNLHGEL